MYSIPRRRRERAILVYLLLRCLEGARLDAVPCTHHHIECWMRSNYKAVDSLLMSAMESGWVTADKAGRAYLITEPGRAVCAELGRLLPMAYSLTADDFLRRIRGPSA